MSIIKKIINPEPKTVWFLEETGENYSTEERAKLALESYLIKLDRQKANSLINEVLFGCVWVKHYGENALIRPGLNSDGWFKEVDPKLKYDYDHSNQRGVIDFWNVENFPKLMAGLIKNGVEVAFTGSEGESGFLMHDCQPGIVVCLDKNLLALENKMNEALVKAAHEYCLFVKGQGNT